MADKAFGNRQAGVLCNLAHQKRLDLIAEGLPVVRNSALSFWAAAERLGSVSREARVLEGFAEEEASKALILMDIVRCPQRRADRRIGAMVKTFYDHLGRLIYVDAQLWRPVNFSQLRTYVDEARKGHCLDGYAGELIVPNWNRYSRESAIYTDIEVHEDGQPRWNDPAHYDGLIASSRPPVLDLVDAMHFLGLFDRRGLHAVSEIWGAFEFTDEQHFDDSRRLTRLLFEALEQRSLFLDGATDDHARKLINHWQMPMYNLDFKEIPVPIEDLKAEREAAFWHEAGYHPAYG
ncbi:MAG TPA: hypothetical protein VFP12_15460 [Allosphingosinicella sp.]|nr:hypothetical protein [Allosphingosinicella sp.]